ncbi:EH domain-containing protein 3-like [Corticium candelabrum]|uniref:EH domain-containing protein 3-like n=1 Tax=Corticium candelabrum TaxID=121492 RepID=UPI002E266A8C|nr:EH domain-containing protein 3-like [Corticium candelabrum]
MFSWLARNDSRKREPLTFTTVTERLWKCYNDKLQPLEATYLFSDFHYPPMSAPDFEAKPMVLLMGQYSVGKSSFIRYLLERDFPGMRIGPEPTTDRFVAVMHSENDRVIPGNVLAADPTKQFRSLEKFGNSFLQKFECSATNSPVLERVTLIDTPGVLSGEKQRTARGYDFEGVIEWFAQRSVMIILLFDAHKLDISDEFCRCIGSLKGNEEKIRIVLNKADMVTTQELIRVNGALMWSLGKVLGTPEVARVYVGSFWDRPFQIDDMKNLFEAEQEDLFHDIQELQKQDVTQKVNDLIRRARLAKAHCFLISKLKSQMPSFFWKQSTKEALIKDLKSVYDQVQREAKISQGDFPPLSNFQDQLKAYDFSTFSKLNTHLVTKVDEMMAVDIAEIMKEMSQEQVPNQAITGGAFGTTEDDLTNPFSGDDSISNNDLLLLCGRQQPEQWVFVTRWEELKRDHMASAEYDKQFFALEPKDGKLSSLKAREEMVKSKLPNSVLKKIWSLADVDKDGMLDQNEFAIAMFLINSKQEGHDLPDQLPIELIPSSRPEPNQVDGNDTDRD